MKEYKEAQEKKGKEFKTMETYTKSLFKRVSTTPKDPKAKILFKKLHHKAPFIQRL